MKRYALSTALLPLLLTSCSGPLGGMGRIWPDGASVAIDEVTVNASMTGAGSMIVKGVRWTGTNGFAIPGTNAAPVTAVDKPTTNAPTGYILLQPVGTLE